MTTSRIARKPISIPKGVEVKINNNQLTAKGAKGQLVLSIHPFINLAIDNNEISIKANHVSDAPITGSSKKLYRSIAGTTRAEIFNLIKGVSEGFERKLVLVGVGYRAQAKGKSLTLSLGYSNPVEYQLREGVTVETPTQTEIIIKGMNKEIVGLVAAEIRAVRGPEPYKGKGVRYANEVIEIKETKKK